MGAGHAAFVRETCPDALHMNWFLVRGQKGDQGEMGGIL